MLSLKIPLKETREIATGQSILEFTREIPSFFANSGAMASLVLFAMRQTVSRAIHTRGSQIISN